MAFFILFLLLIIVSFSAFAYEYVKFELDLLLGNKLDGFTSPLSQKNDIHEAGQKKKIVT